MSNETQSNEQLPSDRADTLELANMKLRIAQLEAENARLKHYSSLLLKETVDASPTSTAVAKHIEELERQHYRFYQTLMNSDALMAIFRGPTFIAELSNPVYEKVTGRVLAQVTGKPIRDIFPELADQGLFEIMDEISQTGQPFITKEMLVRLDRQNNGQLEDVFFNFSYYPLFTIESAVDGFAVHAIDVTEQVTFRQEIERLSHLKDEFLAVASHDLRTPVTSIKGYIQLLQRNLSRYQQAQLVHQDGIGETKSSEVAFLDNSLQLIAKVLNQVNRLNELINRLLDFSRITEGQLRLQYNQEVDLIKLVMEVVAALSLTSEKHYVLMQPVHSDSILVSCDVTRIEQVLNNLVSNAIKYSPDDTTITIGLELASQGQEVLIWIKDEGYGISQEQQSHLFERFYQVRNEQNATKGGLGLGLYISAEIVKQHGGRIWVESKEGQGSTFYIALPVQA